MPEETFDDPFFQKYKVAEIDGALRCGESGKVCFPTRTQAKKYRREIELRYHKYFRVYQCDFYTFFHYATTDSKYRKNK